MDGCIIYGWMDRKYGWIEWMVGEDAQNGGMDGQKEWMDDRWPEGLRQIVGVIRVITLILLVTKISQLP